MPHPVATLIDRQIAFLHRARSVFPMLSHEIVSKTSFQAPEYFQQKGHKVTVELSAPMTEELLDELNGVAHWMNENFVMRVYAAMESNRVVSEKIRIRQDLDGWEDVDIVRRLRNQIGHGSGRYDPNDGQKATLYNRIRDRFDLPEGYSYLDTDRYPIGIARVLVPLAEGCKRYSLAFLEASGGAEEPTRTNSATNGFPSGSSRPFQPKPE